MPTWKKVVQKKKAILIRQPEKKSAKIEIKIGLVSFRGLNFIVFCNIPEDSLSPFVFLFKNAFKDCFLNSVLFLKRS